MTKVVRMTERVSTVQENGSKVMSNDEPMHQATTTMKGMTKMAIWMEEPTATARARSILLRMATRTAVMCSHALEAIGSTMTPMKAFDM